MDAHDNKECKENGEQDLHRNMRRKVKKTLILAIYLFPLTSILLLFLNILCTIKKAVYIWQSLYRYIS